MSADEYVPSDEQVRTTFVEGASEDAYAMSWHEPYAEAYDRWLAVHDARVQRDAAREALSRLIEHADLLAKHAGTDAARSIWQTVAGFAEGNRETHYPEETP